MNSTTPSKLPTAPRTHPPGLQCLACGYNLAGTAPGPCPKCGTLYDSKMSRRLTAMSRWIAPVHSNNIRPELAILALALLSIYPACLGVQAFLALAIVLPWPYISLAIGTFALRLVDPGRAPLHTWFWHRFQLVLWTPMFVGTALATIGFLGLHYEGPSGLIMKFLMSSTTPILVLLAAAWALAWWSREMKRFRRFLIVPHSVWPWPLAWLPLLVTAAALLAGLIPPTLFAIKAIRGLL